MTKMSNAQRIAILDFHHGVTAKKHTMVGHLRTLDALVRNGWATRQAGRTRHAYVTTAGLIAAGVDMDAIHGDALIDDDEHEQAARVQHMMDAIHTHAIAEHIGRQHLLDASDSPRGRLFAHAIAEHGFYPAAMDAIHADALEYVKREQHIAQSGVAHVRNNCPALRVGGCMQCTAPATVRAARGGHVDSYA